MHRLETSVHTPKYLQGNLYHFTGNGSCYHLPESMHSIGHIHRNKGQCLLSRG